jgi:alpha-galactosidase
MLSALVVFSLSFTASLGAQLPPMGMHTWYVQRPGWPTSEALVLEQFDRIATNGWQAAGYNLVVIDDAWQGSRDTNGVLQADPAVFPHGMRWLVEHAHSRGFKLGIYTEPTATTAAGRLGSEGHLEQDARTFAELGFDFIKFDMGLLNELYVRPERDTAAFAAALQAANWKGHLHLGLGLAPFGPWVLRYAQSWRGSYGVPPYSYESPGLGVDVAHPMSFGAKIQVLRNWDRMMEPAEHYGPGKWASMDACPTWFAHSEPAGFRFCLSLFSMGGVDMFCGSFPVSYDLPFPLSKPLATGEYLRINQDPLCAPPAMVQSANRTGIYGSLVGWEVWKRPLGQGEGHWQAVLVLNRSETGLATIALNWNALGYPAGTPLWFVNLETGACDLVTEKEVTIPPFSTAMFKVGRSESVNPFQPRIVRWQRLPGNELSLAAASLPGRESVLHAASSLAVPVSWTPVATNTADLGGTVYFTDTVGGPSRFYRLETR